MLSLAPAFGGGILWLHCLPALPSATLLAVLLPLLVATASFRRLRPVTWLLLGFLWAWWQADQRLARDLAATREGADLVVRGYIATLPESSARSVRFIFQATHLQQDTDWIAFTPRLRLSWYESTVPLRAGDGWELRVRLKRRHGLHNPGGFDYEGWLFQQGIAATGYIREGKNRPELEGGGIALRLRRAVDDRLTRVLGDNPQAGTLRALALGARDGISSGQWQTLRVTGTSHLVAISGLHVGLVAGLGLLLGRWLWARSHQLTLRLAASRAGALTGLLAATLYALLAGFSIPTRRAWIMAAVMLGALLLRRRHSSWHGLALAFLLVLVDDPFAVISAGFWLSFTAVAIIFIGLSTAINVESQLSVRLRARQLGRIQLLLSLGLLPLTLSFFGLFSWVAPFANLLAVPWTSLVLVPLLFAGLLCLYPLPALAGFLFDLAGWAAGCLYGYLDALAALPAAAIQRPSQPSGVYLLATAAVFLVLLPRGLPRRTFAGMLLLPLATWTPVGPAPGQAWVSLLDVGQGLAAVVRTRRHTLVYDAGPAFGEGFDAGSAVVAPYLAAAGVTRIDTLVISHGDNDHRGGAAPLNARVPVYRVLTSVPERVDWRYSRACHEGQSWDWDGVRFRIIHPAQAGGAPGNDRSCVLLVETPDGDRLLLPGDIEAGAEAELVRRYGDGLASRVLVVPHHGSRTSSTASFLERVDPELALIPAGYRNRYGFPKPDVVDRYRRRGVTVLTTGGSGAIRLTLGDGAGAVAVQQDRDARRRYWQAPVTVPLDQ